MVSRLLLVEDHATFRGALAFLLNLRPGMEVVAECGSLSGCRALECLGCVDVAVLDLKLPDGDGTELVAVLRAANSAMKVLVLSAHIEPGVHERVAKVGVDRVLNKATALTEIAAAVTRLADVGGA